MYSPRASRSCRSPAISIRSRHSRRALPIRRSAIAFAAAPAPASRRSALRWREHGVGRCGELGPVTDQELELCGLIAKIHEQVAGRPDLLTQPPETPLARQTWAIS